MFRTYKYRLKPTKTQAATLESWLQVTRELYNAALEERRDAWRKQRKSISRFDQQAQIAEIRRERQDAANVPIVALRGVLRRIELAFQDFFRRCKAGEKLGYPRFKSARRWDSFIFENACDPKLIDGKRIKIPFLGKIRVSLHRPLEGTPKTLKLKRSVGKWYVLIGCEDVLAKPLPATGTEVGIDLGLTHFVATSDGELFDNPRPLRTARLVLERAQRRVSRRKKGSNRRRKAVALLAKHHARVANIRREHHIRVARSLVARYDVVHVEKLNIDGLVKSALSKHIYDAGWSSFRHWLDCKAEEAGRRVIEKDPRGTSQMCSACGAVEKKTLAVRVHRCGGCGFVENRDVNAAINILRAGPARRPEAPACRGPRRPEKSASDAQKASFGG